MATYGRRELQRALDEMAARNEIDSDLSLERLGVDVEFVDELASSSAQGLLAAELPDVTAAYTAGEITPAEFAEAVVQIGWLAGWAHFRRGLALGVAVAEWRMTEATR